MAGRMDFERINGGERKNLSGGRMNFDNLKKKFSFEYPENLPSIEQVKQETSNSSYTPESPNKNISISDRVLGAGLSVTKGSIGTVKSIPDLVSFAGNTVSKGKFENTSAGKATRWVSDFFNEAMDIAQDIKPEKIQELEANKIIGRDENGNWSVNAPNVAQATNAILESIPQIPAYLAGGKGVIAIGGKVGQKLQFLADKYKTIGNIFNFVGKNAQPLSQGVVNAPIIASQTASDVYGDVYKTLVDQGIPQEEAKEIAARQGATAGSQIMPIAGVTGMGLGFAQKNTGKVTSRSLKGFAKETVSEAPEEYAQNIVENRNVAQFDTTRDPSLLNPDALNAGALGAITGGAMGSIVGALSKEEKKGEIIKKETVEDTYKRSQENNVNFNDVVDASFEQKTTPQEALDMLILQKSKETETNQEKPLYGIKKAEEKARIEGAKTTLALQEGKKEDLSGSGIEQKFKQLDDKLTQKNNEIETLIKNSQNKETADPNYAERKQALEKERQSIMSEMDALFPEFQKTQNKVKGAEIVEAPEIKKDEKVKISTIENKKETSQDVVFPIKRVEKAYQHMHLSPGNTAKSEEASLNNEVSNIEKEIKKYNPEISDEELNSIKSSYRKNYIQNRESVWRSAENVVSSAVAGRNKFNKKQADKRGSSYDNSASRFDEWNAKEKESIFEKTGVNKGKEIDRKKENEKKLSKENDAKKKKIEYFVSLKKGDKIKLNGGNDVTVVKKNKTSIVTENGTVWTAKELYGIDHKELQEAYKKKTVVSKTKTPKEIKPIKNVISSNKKTLVSKNIEMSSFSYDKDIINEAKKYPTEEEFLKGLGKTVYHGGVKLADLDGKKYAWFSTSQEVAGVNAMPAYKWFQRTNNIDVYNRGKARIAEMEKLIDEAGIERANVQLQKPFVVDAEGANYSEIKTPKELKKYTDLKEVDTDIIADWAKKNGYDGVIIKNVDEGKGATEIADTIAVFDRSKIKTKSQLSAIYKQAQEELKASKKTGIPKKESPNKSLIEEAKKYKSAEEFINSNIYYHGTNKKFNEFGKSTSAELGRGYYLTPDKYSALKFAHGKSYTRGGEQNIITAVPIYKKPLILGEGVDGKKALDLWEKSSVMNPNGSQIEKIAKNGGYDAVIRKGHGEGDEIMVFDKKNIRIIENITPNEGFINDTKSRSQLSAIYKQAQEELKAPKTEYTNKSLIEEAKKYKSADEFLKAQGTPMYHGSTVENLNELKLPKNTGKAGENQIKGIYLTPDYQTASYYGRINGIQVFSPQEVYTKGNILKVNDFTELEIKLGLKDLSEGSKAKIPNLLKEKGYDGVFLKRGGEANEMIITNPNAIKTKSQLSAIYKQAHEGISIPSLFDEVQSAFLGNIERVSNLSDKELLESKETEALKRIIESFKDKELTPELASSLVFNTLEKVLNPDAEGNASSNAFYKNFMIHVGNLKGMTYDEALGILRHETFHNIAAILKGEKFDSVLLNWYRGLSESKKIGLFKTSLNDTEEQKQDRYNQYKDHYEKYLSSEKEIEFYMANEAFAHAIQFDGLNTPTMARKIINAVKDLITRILRLLRVQYANKENAESKYRYRKIESMVSDFFNPKGSVNISEENSAKFKEARERLNNLIFDKHKNNFAQYQKEMSMPSLSVKKNELQEHDSRLIDPKHREEYEKTLQEVAYLIVQEKEYIQYQKQQSIFDFGWDEETESNYEKFVSLAKTYKKQASKDVLASGDHEQVKKLLTGKGKMTSDEVDNMLYGTDGKSENEVLSLFQERMEREDPIAYYGTKTAKSFDKITVQDAKENLENGNSPASEQYFALKDKLYDLYMQSGAYQEELVNKSIEGLGNEPKKATLKTVGLSRENGKTYTKSERVLLNKKIKDMSKGARMGYSAGRMDAKKKITDMFRKKLSIQKEKLTDKVNWVKWDARMKAQEIREIKKELVDYIEKNLPVYARSGFLNSVEKVENKKGLQKVFSRIDELVEKIEKKNKIKSIVNDIHKISKADNIAIDYKKEILEFSKLVDFKQRTKQAYEKMRRLKEYFMRSGKNTEEIPSRILDMIRLLERRNASELSMWELNIFHEKLLSLYQFGKTKLKLINSITEHEKERIKESLMNGTKRIDDVIIHKAKPGEKLTLKKQLKNVLLKAMFSAKQKGFAIMPMDAFFDLLDGLSNYSGANYTNFKKRIDLSFQKYLDYRDFVQSNVLNLGRSLGLSDRNYERIGVYASLKQEGGLDKLIATGVTKEEAESVVLDEKEMKMYKEMRKIFDEMLPRIKKFMRIVYNKDVQQVENYFSFMTDFEAMNDLEMQEKFGASPLSGDDNNGTRRTKTTKKDFTISRKGGTQTIKLNAMSIFLLHTDNVAYMLNMGRDIKILYEVANSQEYKAKAGTRGSVIVLDWLDTMARKGGMTGSQTLKWLDTLRKNVGVAVLGLKLSSALIQPTALLDGAAKIGRYAFYGATKLSDKKWRQFLMKNFQELRDRVGDDPALLEKTRGLMETIRRGAYSGIKFFDSLTASALTAGAYMKYMDDNGKTIDFENPDPKGVEYAQRMLRATQSSAFFKDVPQAISRGKITGNISLDKALFQFQNFMLTRWSLIRHDAIRYGINKKEYSKSIGIFSYIMLAAISSVGIRTVSGAIIAGLFGGGDDDNKENGFSLKVAKELLSTVPFVSQIVGAIMYQSNPVPIIQTAESIFSGAGSIVYGKKAETKQRGVIRTVIGASKLLGVPGMTQLEEFIRNQKESSISTSSSPIVKNGGVKKLTPKKIEIKNFE